VLGGDAFGDTLIRAGYFLNRVGVREQAGYPLAVGALGHHGGEAAAEIGPHMTHDPTVLAGIVKA
jgi:hypothetical protein